MYFTFRLGGKCILINFMYVYIFIVRYCFEYTTFQFFLFHIQSIYYIKKYETSINFDVFI